MATGADALTAAHAMPRSEVVAAVAVDPDAGLAEIEAARRLALVGPNELAPHERTKWSTLLLEQFTELLVLVLIAAALVSGFALDEWVEASVILAIVVLNAALGFWQATRAEVALESVRLLTAPEATVVRDGARTRIAASGLVPGDVVVVETGDRVAADARVLDASRLSVDEALLTGESFPVDKSPDAVPSGAGLGERSSMLHLGTVVVRGRGRAVVTATGPATEMGTIATLTETRARESTPLQQKLHGVAGVLVAISAAVAVVVFVLGAARGAPVEEMILTAVALAIAAIPEGLPAAVTVTLALGVQRLALVHALVRRLPAVEALGSATVICTDKTGTLTRNQLRAARIARPGSWEATELGSADEVPSAVWRVAALCSDATLTDAGPLGDPTEVALLMAAAARLDVDALRHAHPRLDEVEFDSTRKRMSTLHLVDDGYLVATKGAPEVVLARCATQLIGDEDVPFGTIDQLAARAAITSMARAGLRVLALAERRLAHRPDEVAVVEDDLVMLAVIGLLDEPRDEARPAVNEARKAGIHVAMITGDHAATAATIGRAVGLVDEAHEVLDGPALAALDDDELRARAPACGVYARVDPADKLRIVDAYRANGDIVAMTGDGVNDAPALRAADIGIAMGSGTDVSKDAADMVLADDNFATIVAAVSEGRRIFLNLQKIVFFLLAANIAEVAVVTVGLVLGIGEGPVLLAPQILWMNLVTDGLPVVALAIDPAPKDVMDHPPVGHRALLGRQDGVVLAVRGLVLAAAALAVLAWAWSVRGQSWAATQTATFTALVLVQLWYAAVVRRRDPQGRSVRPRGNPALLAAIAGSAVLQVLVVETSLGQRLFGTVALPALDWAVVVGVTGLAAAALLAVPEPRLRRLGGGSAA